MNENRLERLLRRVVRSEFTDEIPMLDALKELDALSKESSLDKQMVHYLSKRSYEKALTQLETGESCGHHGAN